MAERPIIFSPEMSRAIREGRKTETRRVINVGRLKPSVWTHGGIGAWGLRDALRWIARSVKYNVWSWPIRCPYGDPGDRLWVRERWAEKAWTEGDLSRVGCQGAPVNPNETYFGAPLYAIHRSCCQIEIEKGGWRPSIHMPRWACRTVLEVVERFPQRLQEISEASARREGIRLPPLEKTLGGGGDGSLMVDADESPVDAFRMLWDQINAKRGYPWDSNPWVWVIRFKVVED